MKKINFLLVGGFGFLGKHLIKLLQKHENEFTIISRKEPSPPWNDYNFLLSSALDEERVKQLALAHNVLVYMASSSIPGSSTVVNELDNNVRPAVDFINRVTDYNQNLKVIYLSSGGQVYGNDYTTPIKESYECKPVSPYAYGKLLIEQSLSYLHRKKNINVAILRIANPVGQWQIGTQQGLVNVVLQSIKHDKVLPIFGTGFEVRDYIDADDVTAIIEIIANSDFRYEIFNIGTGKAVSTIEIIQLIESIWGKQVEKKYLPRRLVDPKYAVLDCSKITERYDWNSNKDIAAIMLKTFENKIKNNLL